MAKQETITASLAQFTNILKLKTLQICIFQTHILSASSPARGEQLKDNMFSVQTTDQSSSPVSECLRLCMRVVKESGGKQNNVPCESQHFVCLYVCLDIRVE